MIEEEILEIKRLLKKNSGHKIPYVLLILLIIFVWWQFKGVVVLEYLLGENQAEKYFNDTVAKLKNNDPEAARILGEIKRQQDVKEWAVAFKAKEKTDGLSGVRSLAGRIKEGQPVYEKVLVEYALKPGSFNSSEERDHFLFAYDEFFEQQSQINPANANRYSTYLENISSNSGYWEVVKNDPAGMVMLENGVFDDDKSLSYFYMEQRDWLLPVLGGAIANISDSEDLPDVEKVIYIKNVLRRSMQFYPASKYYSEIEDDSGLFWGLFLEYAHVLSPAVTEYVVSPEEAASVIFANQDQFYSVNVGEDFTHGDIEYGKQQAQELAFIKNNKPGIWKKSQEYPLVLRFEKDALDAGDKLLEKYEYLPEFIYSLYPDEAVQAIKAVDLYGDAALYILQKYSHSNRMHDLLKDKNINTRIIPMILKRGDAAFDLIDDDIRWVNRYTNQDGSMRDDSQWLMAIPLIGAPAAVINNWRNGIPNTWGELGWAAFDVVSCVAIIYSLPANAVKTAGKEAFRTTARATGKSAVTNTAQSIMRASFRTISRGGISSSLRSGVIVATRQTFLRSYIAAFVEKVVVIARASGKVVRYTWNQTKIILKNPVARKWIVRASLATYFAVVLSERTIPNLPAVGTKIGEITGKAIHNTAEAFQNAYTSAIAEALNTPPGHSSLIQKFHKGVNVFLIISMVISMGRWVVLKKYYI
jgi:hypothetical protein